MAQAEIVVKRGNFRTVRDGYEGNRTGCNLDLLGNFYAYDALTRDTDTCTAQGQLKLFLSNLYPAVIAHETNAKRFSRCALTTE